MHIPHSVLIFIVIACLLPGAALSDGGGGRGGNPPPATPPPPPSAGATPPVSTPAAKTETPVIGTTEKPPTAEEITEFIKKATEEQEKLAKEATIDAKLLENVDKMVKAPDVPVGELKSEPFEEFLDERRRRRLWRRGRYSKDKPYLTIGQKIGLKPPKSLKFKIEKFLGEGSYGEVYQAEMQKGSSPPKKVAIKTCPFYYTPTGKPQEMSAEAKSLGFEFDLLKKLITTYPVCSQYLVNPIDKGRNKVLGFMAMELAEFGTLGDYVASTNDRTQFPSLITQMILGVNCMHKAGYSHGDLKPENFLVRKSPTNTPEAIVADFGFASEINKDFVRAGTHIYAPPEVFFNAAKISKVKVDEFSIGATILSMYTKNLPLRTKFTQGGSREGYGPVYFSKNIFRDNQIPMLVADLVQRLCWPDPAARMTLKEALKHPFINRNVKVDEFLKIKPFPVDGAGKVFYVVPETMKLLGFTSPVDKSMNVPTPTNTALAQTKLPHANTV